MERLLESHISEWRKEFLMEHIFNLNNRFFTTMSKVADIIILNLVFLLTCIPLVTIGASVTALYGVTLKLAEKKEPYIVQEYFRLWKENFRQSTVLWLGMVFVGILLAVNLSLKTTGAIYLAMRIGMVIGAVLWTVLILYLFPLLAKFENSIKQTVANAFLIAARHLFTTGIMLGINIVFLFFTLLYPPMFAQMILFWFLLGFAVTARMQSYFLNKVFQRHI